MKKILLLLLLFTGIVNGQIVNIPDLNFKAGLISQGCDTNNDGEIQVTEAQAQQQTLGFFNNTIVDFTGLEAFTNVDGLFISNSQITSFNLLGILNVTRLILDLPSASSVNLNSMPNLLRVSLDMSVTLTDLNFSNCVSITNIEINNSGLSSLNFTGLNQLQEISLTSNYNLTSITGDGLSSFNNFSFYNQLTPSVTSISFTNCPLLLSLNLSSGFELLQSLNLSNCTGLESINVSSCSNLSSINTSGCSSLKSFSLLGTQINALDLSTNVNLETLGCQNSQLTTLDLSSNVKLKNLFCSNTPLVALDLNANTLLEVLNCNQNNFLQTLFIKNGSNQTVNLLDSNALVYVCADLSEVEYIRSQINDSMSTFVGDYCSFTPGGDYNTITGSILYDSLGDGCDSNDLANPYLKVNINDGSNSGSTFTNNSGNYNFYTQAGNFTVTPELENPSYFNFSPPSAIINFPVVDNTIQTQNFCITANGVHPDLEVTFVPLGNARPGFDTNYKIVYKNKGNQTLSGNIKLSYDSTKLDFVATFPNDNFELNPDEMVWTYSTLQPLETRNINLTLHVIAPPTVNNGDVLNFTTTINPILADETPLDNVFVFNQTVVNSYDPNQIACLEGNTITPEEVGNYLHYNINFENIGTADAINIVVKDTINTAKFNINSLQLQYASHDVETKVSGNIVEFIFKNIHLQPSNGGPIGGHGNVLFKIKTLPNLGIGDEVLGSASIFFDYNAPIATNEERTLIASLSKNDFIKDETITVAPNPARNTITVSSKNKLKSVLLFDVQGRLLQTVLEHNKTTTLDISSQANGVYFLKVITEIGSSVEKIVKEN